jgi:iron complex transport system substrate-binding protein
MASPKIISLLPAATEIVCALGLEQNLVGKSHECDYPESVKDVPVCSGTKLTLGSESAATNQQVKDLLDAALSIYTVDKEIISRLNPDVVITQSQCNACAVSLNDVEEALEDLLNKDVDLISLEPTTLDDIFVDIKSIANRFGVKERGETLLEQLHERVDIIQHKLKFIADKPTVACIEWLEPLMLAGNWIPEMISIAGGASILTGAGKHSPYVEWEKIKAADPDIIIVMPCGFPIERTMKEIDLLLGLPGFPALKAVKNNRLYIADGNQYFNRSGPRIVDSIEILAEIIYPKQFIFGYEGKGWIRFAL